MSLHHSHTHNKGLRDTIEEQLEEMEAGEGGLKLVSRLMEASLKEVESQ